MSEVHKVTVQIKPPNDRFPGSVAFGFYKVVDGVVIMTDPDGNPAGDETGKKFSHKLGPNEDARAVACKLTRELRLALRGTDVPVNGFERGPIAYPKDKFWI